VLTYTNADGSKRREYRAPEEVFSPESLASLAGAPVTNLHPPEGRVDASNAFRSAGAVATPAAKAKDGIHVEADLALLAPDLIEAVEDGRTDVSCGYDCRVDHAPGVSPEGEPGTVCVRCRRAASEDDAAAEEQPVRGAPG
jgi:hypothetical protein